MADPAARSTAAAVRVVRGLRLVALAETLALVALVADARLRPPPPEPAVLLPTPPPAPVTIRSTPAPAQRPPAEQPPAEEPLATAPQPAAATQPAEPESPAPTGPEAGPPPQPPEPSQPAAAIDPDASLGAGEPAPAPSPPAPPPGPTVRDGVQAYQAGDYARAFAIWRPLAEAGNARARFHLGALYLEGRLGSPDPEQAFRWLALAAEAGQSAAGPLRDRAAAMLAPERLAALRAELGLPAEPAPPPR